MIGYQVSQAQTKPKQMTRKEFAREKGKANTPNKHTLATRPRQIPKLYPPLASRHQKGKGCSYSPR